MGAVGIGYASNGPASNQGSLTERIGSMIDRARETLEMLTSQHERLFGPVPARPEATSSGAKLAGPPTAEDGVSLLSDTISRLQHVTHCLASRI
jgi:hypothetical protein